jgi:hypothetical protein
MQQPGPSSPRSVAICTRCGAATRCGGFDSHIEDSHRPITICRVRPDSIADRALPVSSPETACRGMLEDRADPSRDLGTIFLSSRDWIDDRDAPPVFEAGTRLT